MYKYHSDQPIYENSNDEFNRSSFADDFVKILSDFEKDENYIVGLFAKWGFGKTSTVNLILEKLKNNSDFCSVNVSAWVLNGNCEKILWDILSQVHKNIEGKNLEKKRFKLGRVLTSFSKAELPFEFETEFDLNSGGRKETKVSSGKIVNTANFLGQMLASSDNIAKARKRVEKSISDSGKKVVVFIDDLDRLEGKQIMDILRTINTIADYGGMTYILPFDKVYVCSAIEEYLPKNQSGAEFIKKLIQIPINLPALTQTKIDKVLLSKLDSLLNDFKIRISEDEVRRFQKLYLSVNKYITSPRDINKMINVFRFKLPTAYEEVNIVDTIILEVIRVFDEPLYEIIRSNRDLLLKRNDEKNVEKVLNVSESQLQIIQELFPEICVLYTNRGSIEISELRQLQRIASWNYFDLFFASLDEEEGVSDKKIIQLLQLSDEPKVLRTEMNTILNQNNFTIALGTMRYRIELIKNPLDFSKALLDVFETFPLKYQQTGLGLSLFDSLTFLIHDIFMSSKLEDYITLLDYSYQENRINTLLLLVRDFVLFSEEHNGKKEINLSDEKVEEYKKHALEIISKIAEQDKISIDTCEYGSLFYSYWGELGGKSECSKYIKKHVKTVVQAVDFISQFLGKTTEVGKNDYHRMNFNEQNYKSICDCIEPSYFYNLFVNDEKYKTLKNSSFEELISFDDRFDEKFELSKIGNEHTDEFRFVVARQFMYFYENHSFKVAEEQWK